MAAPASLVIEPVEQHIVEIDSSLRPLTTSHALNEWNTGPRLPRAAEIEARRMVGANAMNGLVLAAHHAFQLHLDLVLRPHDLWFTILQGVALHVNQDPDKYRALLVKHKEGKIAIRVQRDALVRGKGQTPEQLATWESLFPEFVAGIEQHRADTPTARTVTQTRFDTHDPLATVAMQVATMDVMQGFFSYVVDTFCGIPRVVLMERRESWQRLLDAVVALDLPAMGLAPWNDRLLATLRAILSSHGAAQSDTDKMASEGVRFWRSLYKIEHGSGGSTMSGWILDFFPYVKGGHVHKNGVRLNTMPVEWHKRCRMGVDELPSSLSRVPFAWSYNGSPLPMFFYAGLDDPLIDVGAHRVECRFGWAVVYDKPAVATPAVAAPSAPALNPFELMPGRAPNPFVSGAFAALAAPNTFVGRAFAAPLGPGCSECGECVPDGSWHYLCTRQNRECAAFRLCRPCHTAGRSHPHAMVELRSQAQASAYRAKLDEERDDTMELRSQVHSLQLFYDTCTRAAQTLWKQLDHIKENEVRNQ